MNDPIYNRLTEAAQRRKLTSAERAELQAWLAAHPEARADWELEQRLNAALAETRDVPVPSNFTARVLQAVERENAAARRASRWSWRSWLPKAAIAGLLAGAGLFSYYESLAAKRVELARSVATVSGVTSLPAPEVLEDFEAIRLLNTTPPPDLELLALMQ